jgi:peptide/nickel transport system substrate-binding protein
MRQLPNVAIDVFEPAELYELHLNTNVAPLNDIRVRQAVAHAINRDELLRFVGPSVARPARSVVPIGYLGFVETPQLPYDPDRARALLREAGFANGVTIHVIQTQLPVLLSAMQVMQAQLRRVGITLELDLVDHPTFHAQIRRDLSAMVYYGAARFPVADAYLSQFFHSAAIVGTPTAVTNFSHCRVADAEIDQARSAVDRASALRLWAEAQRKIVAEVCAIAVIEQMQVWARRSNLDYGYEFEGAMTTAPMLTEATQLR